MAYTSCCYANLGTKLLKHCRPYRLTQTFLEQLDREARDSETQVGNGVQRFSCLCSYMNLQLANSEEYIDGQIRCNNVLHLRGVPEDEETDEADRD